MSVTKERILVSRGNYAVLAAGIKVIDCPNGNCKGAGVTFPAEAFAGQFVFYKNDPTMLSVDPSATPTTVPVVLGLFHDENNDGRITEIIKIAGDKLHRNSFISLRGQSPVEGQEEVSRYMFNCVKKATLYKLFVDVESDRSHKEFYKNRKARRVLKYMAPTSICEDGCDDDAVAREIACGLVDDFNNYRDTSDPFKQGWPLEVRQEPLGIEAFVYNDTTFHFCLTGTATVCGVCENFTGVKGIRIAGVNHTFTGLLNTATTSHEKQVKELIKLINCQFDKHQGWAWKERGLIGEDACISFGIAINSCKTIDGLIRYDDTLITPCEIENVAFTKPNPKNCIDCGGSDNAATTYTGAIGFVGHLAEENCSCDGFSDNPVRYYPTHATAFGEGFVDGTFEITQEAKQPQNFGVQWWNEEYLSDVRPGFSDNQYRSGGKFNNLLSIARSKGMLTDCDEAYCSISWQQNGGGDRPDPIGHWGGTVLGNVVLIPKSHTTTSVSLLADLNALKNAGDNLFGLPDVTCDPDPQPGPPSPSVSRTPDSAPSVTPTVSISKTITVTPSISRSNSTTPSVSKSITPTVTVSVTVTKTPSVTPSPSL